MHFERRLLIRRQERKYKGISLANAEARRQPSSGYGIGQHLADGSSQWNIRRATAIADGPMHS